MNKPEEIYCPRCNSSFVCNAGNIINCQCYGIELNEAARNYLSSTGLDCLCKDCLEEINLLAKPLIPKLVN